MAIIEIEFDARGVEGQFVSTWTRANANGDDCFPCGNASFAVTIKVVNKAFSNDGGKIK